MANQADAPTDDGIEAVKKWVGTTGYPLEFHVATVMAKAGFKVTQSHYTDSIDDSNKQREVDVIASMELGAIRVNIVAECKYAKKKPWIIFSSLANKLSYEQYVLAMLATDEGTSRISFLANNSDVHSLQMVRGSERSGYLVRVAHSTVDPETHGAEDIAYRAMQSVTDNSLSLTAKDNRHASRVFFPTVIIDGNLYECFYDETRQSVEVVQVSEMQVHWRANNNRRLMTVDVVTKAGLEAFLVRRVPELRTLMSIMGRVEKASGERR